MYDTESSNPHMDVTGSLSLAWDRMKLVLFQPFNIMTWLAIGLMVFMEMLGQPSGGNFNIPDTGSGGSPGGGVRSPADVADVIDEFFVKVSDNIELVLGIGIPVLGLVIGLYLLFLWLSSRGMLMFVRAVARNDARVGDNWRATRFLVGSLWKVRAVVQAINWLVVLGGLVGLFFVLYRLLRRDETEWTAYVFELGPLVLVWTLVALVPALVSLVIRNFVAPMMLQFQESCGDAFRRFLPVLLTNVGPLVLFVVLRMLFHLAFGLANLLIVIFTCCLGGLPVINQALTAPFHVFDRAWSMFVLRSLGPDYDLFREPEPAPLPQLEGTWGQQP